MWQTKYASAVPKNLGLGSNFWPWASVVRDSSHFQFKMGMTGDDGG